MDATDWSACDSGRSFAAIDFETATSQRSSACAVGVVIFNEGSPVDTRRLLDNCGWRYPNASTSRIPNFSRGTDTASVTAI